MNSASDHAIATTAGQLHGLRADTYRQYAACNWKLVVIGALTRRTFRPLVSLRMCQAADRGARWLLPFCKLLHKWTTHRAAMDLPWRTQIGAGAIFTHGWGLVVNEGVRIGRNVTLFHGVTLGQGDRIDGAGQRTTTFPVLEDEVWVGPNAIIVGGVTIGRGARIIGGAFIHKDVPPYTIMSGNPAVALKSGCVPDVVNPAP